MLLFVFWCSLLVCFAHGDILDQKPPEFDYTASGNLIDRLKVSLDYKEDDFDSLKFFGGVHCDVFVGDFKFDPNAQKWVLDEVMHQEEVTENNGITYKIVATKAKNVYVKKGEFIFEVKGLDKEDATLPKEQLDGKKLKVEKQDLLKDLRTEGTDAEVNDSEGEDSDEEEENLSRPRRDHEFGFGSGPDFFNKGPHPPYGGGHYQTPYPAPGFGKENYGHTPPHKYPHNFGADKCDHGKHTPGHHHNHGPHKDFGFGNHGGYGNHFGHTQGFGGGGSHEFGHGHGYGHGQNGFNNHGHGFNHPGHNNHGFNTHGFNAHGHGFNGHGHDHGNTGHGHAHGHSSGENCDYNGSFEGSEEGTTRIVPTVHPIPTIRPTFKPFPTVQPHTGLPITNLPPISAHLPVTSLPIFTNKPAGTSHPNYDIDIRFGDKN